jgi:hypothetical protein
MLVDDVTSGDQHVQRSCSSFSKRSTRSGFQFHSFLQNVKDPITAVLD